MRFGNYAALSLVATLAACSPPAARDKASIEKIVHDYILEHPEIVPAAIDRLQQDKARTAIIADRKAIETPFAGAWAGNASPKVVLTMFTDYNCTYCRASAPDVARLLAEEPDLKVVWREIPVLGPQSEVAAKAALAAARAGRYVAFHQGLFAAGHPDPATLTAVAAKAGLDPARVATDAASPDIAREIDTNLRIAGRIGVSGTPAFVVGDKLLSGAVGYQALKQAVDSARS